MKVAIIADDLTDLLNQIDGREVITADGPMTLSTRDATVRTIGMNFAEKFLHRFGGFARDVDATAFVLHERGGAVRNEQGERDVIQVFRLKRTAFQCFDPRFSCALTQINWEPVNETASTDPRRPTLRESLRTSWF